MVILQSILDILWIMVKIGALIIILLFIAGVFKGVWDHYREHHN